MAEDGGLRGVTACVFGIGEAGTAVAAGLAEAGASVACFDPAAVPDVTGTRREADPAAALAGADLVLAVTAAADAMEALGQAFDAIPAQAVYADLSTASAQLKRELGERARRRSLAFVDVALMAPVPGTGLHTPALASGPGAARYVAMLAPVGVPVTVVGDQPGQAATRKLLRSVVMKGLAALVIEAMRAANAAGLADETWVNLVDQVTSADEAFLRRLVDGTAPHALRRRHEMEAAAALLDDLGVEPVMTRATVESLRRTAGDGTPDLPGRP